MAFCMDESETENRSPENSPVEPSRAFGPAASGFQPLDPNVVHLWRVNQFITTAIWLFLALAGGSFLALAYPYLTPWLIAAWLVFACFRFWFWIWYPPRAFQTWGYHLDDKVLEIKSGVYFRTIQLLPLNRLQHVDLHSGPFERYFGLASLVLHTAGTHESTLVIPGLASQEAAKLRDHLVAIGGDDAV